MMFFKKILLFFALCSIVAFVPAHDTSAQPAPRQTYGAKAALQDPSITLEKALVYALEDEFLAQARYDAIISQFGSIRPFVQIKEAEQRHIQALLPLLRKYGATLPPKPSANYVKVPSTLKDAFQAGVEGEIDNIAMYDKFLASEILPQDVRTVMTNVRDASRKHLAAFQAGLGSSAVETTSAAANHSIKQEVIPI